MPGSTNYLKEAFKRQENVIALGGILRGADAPCAAGQAVAGEREIAVDGVDFLHLARDHFDRGGFQFVFVA